MVKGSWDAISAQCCQKKEGKTDYLAMIAGVTL
jgi:hypothetical protein